MKDFRPILLVHTTPLGVEPLHPRLSEPGRSVYNLVRARTMASEQQYLDRFERRAVVGQEIFWNRSDFDGRTVVVLGEPARLWMGLPELLCEPMVMGGVLCRQLPWPYVGSPWYADPVCRGLAEMVLEEAYEKGRQIHESA